jgi:hypothetical protein
MAEEELLQVERTANSKINETSEHLNIGPVRYVRLVIEQAKATQVSRLGQLLWLWADWRYELCLGVTAD